MLLEWPRQTLSPDDWISSVEYEEAGPVRMLNQGAVASQFPGIGTSTRIAGAELRSLPVPSISASTDFRDAKRTWAALEPLVDADSYPWRESASTRLPSLISAGIWFPKAMRSRARRNRPEKRSSGHGPGAAGRTRHPRRRPRRVPPAAHGPTGPRIRWERARG